jgi:16S rRNA (cytosine967-C5)-methyltransferase
MDLNIETDTLKDQPDALVLKERANVFLTDALNKVSLRYKMQILN